jgi:hypothetical protein
MTNAKPAGFEAWAVNLRSAACPTARQVRPQAERRWSLAKTPVAGKDARCWQGPRGAIMLDRPIE